MNNRLLLAVALNLSLVATASAVKLSPSGIGEVIIVPYYTVQGGNETLLSITNVADDVKAVKVRFLEAQNGTRVQSFNLYLPPGDVWTGKIQISGNAAKVTSYDASCSIPTIDSSGLDFTASGYAGDGGDSDLGRTREGFVEIIEMGVVGDPEIIAAVSFDQGAVQPANCGLIASYWEEGGKWDDDPAYGMGGLAGGLMAEANIINVDDGVEYSQTLTVLDEFNDSDYSLHSCPDCASPTLNSASPAASADPKDTWMKPVDAISGLLMSESLFTVYTVNPVVKATSEWNITFPTKRFYTGIDGDKSDKQPFTSTFGANGACETVDIQHWNRETATTGSSPLDLCYAANIVRVIGTGGESNIFQPEWSGVDFKLADGYYPNGWAEIDFVTLRDGATIPLSVDDYVEHVMNSASGKIYAGLPAIGFSASRLDNTNVGIGAAYAATASHRMTRSVSRIPSDKYCTEPGSCPETKLDVDDNTHYDRWIAAGVRHVYSFNIPTPGEDDPDNRGLSFKVIDLGVKVIVNIGISEIKGKTVPEEGESDSCFAGPRIVLKLSATTDDSEPCMLEFDTDYFFTIENTNLEATGNYRFEYTSVKY